MDGTARAIQELLEIVLDAYAPGRVPELKRPYVASPYALTLLGDYHGDEVQFENGEKIFSLSIDEKGDSALNPQLVGIEPIYDAITDKEGQKTGKRVTLKGEASAFVPKKTKRQIYLLKGGFSTGPVSTAKIPPLNECVKQACQIKLGNRIYFLRVAYTEKMQVEPGSSAMSHLIEISDGASTKVIPGIKQIIWAGDLDRDGKLDLIYDDGFHYNVMHSLHLLLSSPASVTPLIEVASFRSGGC